MKILAAILLLGGALGAPGVPGVPGKPGKPGKPDNYEPNVILRHNDKVVSENSQQGGHPGRSFDLEIGTTRGSLHNLNDEPPKGRAVIFLDSVAGVEGKIGSWQFYTVGQCDFCLAVFNRRKTPDGLTYYVEFAGQNCFNVTDDRPVVTDYEIPMGYKLYVQANSMMGIIFQGNRPPCIRMESNQKLRSKPDLQLGRVMVLNPDDLPEGQQDHFLRPGTIVEENILKGPDGVTDFLGTPSFKAIITGATNILNLAYGEHNNEGFAMIYMNNIWGTICDYWYHELGWAQLFCDEKGFPSTTGVYYYNKTIPDNTPINLMNPRCKLSLNQTMFQCHSREDHPCFHDQDLYIKCKRPVELRAGNGISEGICYKYESNYWGSICDNRGIQISGNNHWAHVCCREVGFSRAKNMVYAKTLVPSQDALSKAAISMHSPDCGSDAGEDINSLKGCKDGPIANRCGHDQDMYIYCE